MAKKWIKGVVRWFDSASGRGVVQSLDGEVYSVHYSAIQTKQRWKTLREKKAVSFQIFPDPDYKMVLKVKEER